MNITTRRVMCACTGSHNWQAQSTLFPPETYNGHYTVTCSKCGAYEKYVIGEGMRIFQGPEPRMRQYWKGQRE